jgi:hypothetical protein
MFESFPKIPDNTDCSGVIDDLSTIDSLLAEGDLRAAVDVERCPVMEEDRSRNRRRFPHRRKHLR